VSVFVLGGAQTDFARRWSREGLDLFDMMSEAVRGALTDAAVAPEQIEVAHIGNFTAELFRGQGQLGGMFVAIDPAFAGVAASRHEAACASGSMAVRAAMADLAAGHYDLACVVGIEEMRNVHGDTAAKHLGAAAWAGRESPEARYLWPAQFSDIVEAYDRRHGVAYDHLMAIARQAFANGARNPHAQTRRWSFDDRAFTADDEHNPVIEGRIRRHDCGQITDGAAAIVLASERAARANADARGIDISELPRITGWGHRTAPLALRDKLEQAPESGPMFPHLARAVADARGRAGVEAGDIAGYEVHDCFTITEYVIVDHLGICEPGGAGTLIESGELAASGRHPINPSGGLIGLGHPVGATGVRMVLDAARQVSGRAGAAQVEGARRFQTVNIGGSFTTVASFVVEA
jgi:acetyl-CoA C-acetyltransferase